ncbi:MAG: FAD-dependent oxidoreductase [Aphanocapsa sp. GSE-SYN-MK-11-07L]|jgi:sarcosine oxidase subunit alpha|nr:FAD-dependent oxidoreductase [Aphanocapsa sp. GSE-SYN-MK-11-07L]
MNLRSPTLPSEWIDRTQPIQFTFEGKSYSGYAGDTITSALWAAGQSVLGRSFKYHRPRGILSLANHDINTLMQAGQQHNLRADVTPIVEGMQLTAVNTWGGVDRDRARLINQFSAFLPVGFYYKAFLDKVSFPFWEKVIRTMTGLGKVDFTTPRISTPKRYDFCDLLVVGAGPSGLSAALAAAERGADVVIVDENARAGGSGGYHYGTITQTANLLAAVAQHPQIRLYTDTTAAGYYADFWIPLVNPDYMVKMRAKSMIVASGAYEQPAVFRNNDLPGVMLASAGQRLLYRYAVKPAERVVILTANSDGYRAAIDMAKHDVTVAAVLDWRDRPSNSDLVAKVESFDIPVLTGHCFYEAIPNSSGDRVAAVIACPVDTEGNPQPERRQRIECDGVLVSVGWSPAANLLYQAGTKMRFDLELEQYVPEVLPPGIFACGRVNGVYDFAQKLLDGQRAGLAAATNLGLGSAETIAIAPASESPTHPYPIVAHPKGKNFVDFDEDLQLKDFHHAIQEGFDNIELLKRYSTVGMGPSQGRHSNMNAIRILARSLGKTPAEVGTTTARPFFHPVPISHLAGRSFLPERFTPLHQLHQDLGAVFMLAGQWRRPEYYRPPARNPASPLSPPELGDFKSGSPQNWEATALGGFPDLKQVAWARGAKDHSCKEFYVQPNQSREQCIQAEVNAVRQQVGLIDVGTLGKLELRREQCIQAEVNAVRQQVGLIDVGTLGKLELRGPAAAEFLERVYGGRYANLKVGISRYALMLDEAGVVIDDGVIARLGAEHFYSTTTTSGAAAVYRELSRLNTIWQLDCGIVNLTGARSAVNLAGPQAQCVLAKLTSLDLSGTAFPYLGVREGLVAGIPALLMRVGFVGEWGYEIHVAAEYGPALWSALIEAGAKVGIRPFGVEAQRLLRLEKGHLIIGQDTDGLTTPREAGLNWAIKLDKPFFVGLRSLQVLAKQPLKQKLVGFRLPQDFASTPPQECCLVIEGTEIAGRVTSIAFSPTLDHYIGLAYVKPELNLGDRFSIRTPEGSLVTATVCPTPFYDPESLRQKVEAAQPEAERSALKGRRVSPLHGLSSDDKTGQITIADLSSRPRFGVKGSGAAAWLASLLLPIPDRPNTWLPLDQDSLIARLGLNEYLIESESAWTKFIANQNFPVQVYPVLRQDAAIALSGPAVNELLLQTCNINFQVLNLAERPLVITTMVGVTVQVIPITVNGEVTYRIWCDGTFGPYLYQTLLKVAHDLGAPDIQPIHKLVKETP